MGSKRSLKHDPMPAYRALARQYGLRFRVIDHYPQRAYNAKGVFNLVRAHVDHAPHEIAHYLVATPAQRRMPEFGLGSSAFFADVDPEDLKLPKDIRPQPAAKVCVDSWDVIDIEAEASLLGIFITRHVEGAEAAAEMYDRHDWYLEVALETARVLLRKKLLIWHKGRLTPRCLVRPPRKSEIYAR
jgi:hypothetical protein